MSYKPADSKREEFRKYLEKSGVLDALTKTLVCLYEEPEKPNNAMDFLKKHLHNSSPDMPDMQDIKNEMEHLQSLVEKLRTENDQLKERLSKYEPVEESK